MSDSDSPPPSPSSEQPVLPWPVAELIRRSEDTFASKWFNDLSPLFAKVLEWSLFFFMGYWGFGYGWVLFLATAHFIKYRERVQGITETMIARLSTLSSEQEVLGDSLSHFPSWVSFPDFDRTEWINEILKQLWPSIGGYATQFVVDFIEPELRRILDQLRLETVSGFQVKKVALGTIPARIGGIKVYGKSDNRDEVVLDAEVIYSGDARVLFSLQGVKAEIKQINFKGMARITLKPVFNTFPFVGGVEFYFLNSPTLDYSLGGIGTFGELPGAHALIKTIVRDQVRSRFVWPNKFHLYLPIEPVTRASDRSFLLTRPAGIMSVDLIEARNLEKKDTSLTGSGKSDPYVIVSVGESKVSFRDRYVAKSLDPVWNYNAKFILESAYGQKLDLEVFDYDNSSTDDFLGRASVSLGSVAEREDAALDAWITLDDVKHGDVHLRCAWSEAEPMDDQDPDEFDSYVVSVLVERCHNLAKPGGKSLPYPKVIVRHAQGKLGTTNPKSKDANPVFEEGFMCVSKNFDTESIALEVVDSKSSDACLGKAKIPLGFLAKSKRKEFFGMTWDLEEGVNRDATIVVSAKLYGVKRNRSALK